MTRVVIRVDAEAEVVMMIDVTHAVTETATTTEAGEPVALALARRTADPGIVTTAIGEIVAIVGIVTTTDVPVMKRGARARKTTRLSLQKMSEIREQFLFSNSLRV